MRWRWVRSCYSRRTIASARQVHSIGVNEVAIGLTMPHSALAICRQRLSTPHFSRAVINAEVFPPAEAIAAGFLDPVVSATALVETARQVAAQLAQLNRAAHEKSKLRAREAALTALRVAIEADDAAFADRVCAEIPAAISLDDERVAFPCVSDVL
jgi:enoyl-CoA hydratase/carnithine racemase